jgi:hypothetical protein
MPFKSAQRRAAPAPFIALSALLALLGCVAQPPQVAASQQGQLLVCAVKNGERQSYWSERAAQLDGAFVVLAGECPAQPNSEGGAGGAGGM